MAPRAPRRQLSRRAVLAGLSATGVGTAFQPARGHPTPEDGDEAGTDGESVPTPIATPSDFAPLAHVHVEGTKEGVVDAAGETAFLATTTGFAAVDIVDPRSPEVLTDRRDVLADHPRGPLVEIHDVDYHDGRLLVVGPANPVDRAVQAAVLFDVSDPRTPNRLAVYETDYPIHNATLGPDVAYLTGNDFRRNALVLADIEAGEDVGSWSVVDVDPLWREVDPILWVVHDATVHDEVAYVANWDAGTWIVDVSDPATPETIARVRGRPADDLTGLTGEAIRHEQLEEPGNDHYAATNQAGTLLGVGIESWDESETDHRGGPGALELWDVADPSTPTRLARIAPPPTSDPTFDGVWTTPHNFAFHGDRLYTSWYRGGVRVYDVSEPTAPELISAWRDETRTSFWAARVARPGSVFVASTRENFGPLGSTDDHITGGLYTFPDPPGPPPETETDLSGFGPLAGAAGIGIGAWRALRGLSDSEGR